MQNGFSPVAQPFPGNQPNRTFLSMNYTQRDVEEARGSLHLLKKRMKSGGRKLSAGRMQTIEPKPNSFEPPKREID